MTISVAIMAHPARADLVDTIIGRLDRKPNIIWDTDNNRWDTGRRAWEAHDPAATHHLVLQDDAIICQDLIAGLESALDHVPDRALVAAFHGTRNPPEKRFEHDLVDTAAEADLQGAAWIVAPTLNWGVAVMTPTGVIGDMLTWCGRQSVPNYDLRLAWFFLRELAWPVWCTWPALVDHADVASLVGNESGCRAVRFIGGDVSAMTIDWSVGHLWVSGAQQQLEHHDQRLRQRLRQQRLRRNTS